jgi:hypothetical protein
MAAMPTMATMATPLGHTVKKFGQRRLRALKADR